MLELDLGARRVERRQLVGAIADHEHAERLEHLDGARQIEDRLGARRDHRDLRARERDEIVRDIAGVAAMDAADAAGREHADPGARGEHRGRADRGRGGRAAREVDREIGGAGLRDARDRRSRSARAVAGSSPMHGSPSMTAIVAGTAPSRAHRRPRARARRRGCRATAARARRASTRARRSGLLRVARLARPATLYVQLARRA